MRLAHLRLTGLVRYNIASQIQDRVVASLLVSKSPLALASPPDPTIITAEFYPVYTCGRRDINKMSSEQQNYLRANGKADFSEALRGGQTTFHGPGQLVAYPIIDLRRHKITPRQYVCLLEKSLIDTCAKFGVKVFTTEHPGVWTSPQHKIAALGVHLRRNVTSHGVGLNVSTDLRWFERIVACGLEGKQTTSLEVEGVRNVSMDDVTTAFVDAFAKRLNIQETYRVADSVDSTWQPIAFRIA